MPTDEELIAAHMKQFFVIELLPMDTLLFGPFLSHAIADKWAMAHCHNPFQVHVPTKTRVPKTVVLK